MINATKIHTITIITCAINCMLLFSCKSLTIFSFSDILIINNGGNVLLIEFALADGMPELLMFIVINAISMACIIFWYLIKNTISVITSIMLHVKAAYDQQHLPHLCIMQIF